MCCHLFHVNCVVDGWQLHWSNLGKCHAVHALVLYATFKWPTEPLLCCYYSLVPLVPHKHFVFFLCCFSLCYQIFCFQDGKKFSSQQQFVYCTYHKYMKKGSWYLLLRPPICRMDTLLMIGAKREKRAKINHSKQGIPSTTKMPVISSTNDFEV